MSTGEQLFAWFMLVCALAMAAFAVRTHLRGWIKDEDGVIQHRENGPRAFLFAQLLQVASVALLVYLGVRGLNGWK